MSFESQKLDFEALTPSLFDGGDGSADDITREIFRRVYPIVQRNRTPYDLNRFVTAAFYYPSIFNRTISGLRDKVACEIGAGGGIKAAAWARLFKRYIAVDLIPHFATQTRILTQEAGIDNVEIVTANGAEFVHKHLGEIDVLILYAVIEHLTPTEREGVLGAIEAHLEAGGTVLVAECPNRLIPMDSHTTRLPFFQSLPDELAIRYMARSPLASWLADKALYATDPHERLYRLGRGVSYHEFDLYCPKLESNGFEILHDGFDSTLLNIEPLQRSEIDLDRMIAEAAPNVPRAFSRYWIEFIARKGTTGSRHTRLKVGSFEDDGEALFAPAANFWSIDWYTLLPGQSLGLQVDGSSHLTLTFNLSTSQGCLILKGGNGADIKSFDVAELRRCRPPSWHEVASVTIKLPSASSRITLTCEGHNSGVTLGPPLL